MYSWLIIAEIPRPSSERIIRKKELPEVATLQDSHLGRPSSLTRQTAIADEIHEDKPRDLSYSLFPPPIDRSRFLGNLLDASKVGTSTESSSAADRLRSNTNQASESSNAIAQEPVKMPDSSLRETKAGKTRKRKRSPSPDVIPNPPGVSYGMDMRYFSYSSSSESEDEPEERSQSARLSRGAIVADKSPVHTDVRSENGPSKRVRFDAGPQNTPENIPNTPRLPCATDPYHGRQFIGIGNDSNANGSDSAPSSPAIPTFEEISQRPGFVFNTEGTYGFDYDDYSGDSDSDESTSPTITTRNESPTVNVGGDSRDHEPRE